MIDRRETFAFERGVADAKRRVMLSNNPYSKEDEPMAHSDWVLGHYSVKCDLIAERERAKKPKLATACCGHAPMHCYCLAA